MKYDISSEPVPGRILFGKGTKDKIREGRSMGPAVFGDPTQSNFAQMWTATISQIGDVVLTPTTGDPIVAFNDSTVNELDLAFTGAGTYVICFRNNKI